ncbi:peptide ABC transporter substrate-binding protein [Niallia endozanthoxylica]|uniref:Peptide ABC transporter substrate-binding protein n=1 Tax=Niallia endozanthoxylica TaxID=2036016 RepID=A0A5J5I1Z6_9BACI|nr:peptide ABC transporter substrate-binding protein [Niallia endozanthoxylica]KAA9027554.1 peptide ABC transporter substrate-binding protein [Niallia endozanthoxylica]
MKKRKLLFLSMLLVLSMFLTACAGGKDNADGSKDGGKEAAQDLRVNINTEPPTLNPGLAEDSTSGTVLRQVFEGLSRINLEGKAELAAAEDVQISEDQKTYTFTLRDAKWTNGDPVTAKDFEYAWKWALDPANASPYSYQLYYLEGGQAFNEGTGTADAVGVKALDDKTLEVKLANPTPFFLELTAFYTYLPVNSKVAEAKPDWANDAGDNYTTNGPFKLAEWSHSDKIVLEKNEDYWDAETVKLNTITMIMVNDPNTELSMFDSGELDWAGMPTGNLPQDALPALKDEGRLHTESIAGIYNYKLNTTVEPFTNANIRKAFALAINRQELIDNVTQGGQLPAMAIVPPTMFPENEKGYFKDNDVKKAKEYLQKGLEELGYKDVSELPPVALSYNTDEGHQKIAQAIQDMWKQNLGVEVTLNNAEWKVYIEQVQSLDYNIARMGWLGDFNDPINFLESYYSATGGNNDTGWENKDFQALLDQSATEADTKKRQELLKQAEEIFMNEMPVIPIYFYTNNWVQADNLKDVAVSGLGDVQFKWAYFE